VVLFDGLWTDYEGFRPSRSRAPVSRPILSLRNTA
jgi:hypothetical protein